MNFFQIFGFGKNKAMRPQDFTSDEAKAAAAWIETVNPLRGMTSQRMQNLYDASRAGDTVHLQWLYQEIEKVDPTLLICQQRRTGALASLDWHISTRNKKRTRSFDEKLAQEQADCLELAFGDADQANFNEAVEHLARGFFRGFAHVLPRWSADGLSLKGFDCLDQWNFVRDVTTGTWYWNPEAHAYTGYADCRPIPPGELVVFVAPYHIDYPAMAIYLRSAVGEKGWAKFVERFGIPPVILTMPQDIPSDQVDAWRRSAEKVAEGGSGAVPFGTNVNFCDGARGINPFKDFIHNQRALVVLMSTGGLLTSLAEAGSGTLAGGAHSDTWAEVRRMDSAKIGSVLNRTLADTILDRAFPGRPHLAYFAFDTEAVPSPGEVFDDATKAKNAGYLIDKADLEERTGYKLIEQNMPSDPATGGMSVDQISKMIYPLRAGGYSIDEKQLERAVGLKLEKIVEENHRLNSMLNKAPSNSNTPTKEKSGADANLLEAFAKDTGAAAEAVAELLKNPSPDAAAALLEKLPSLLPEDPALAAIIAEEMAKQFRPDESAQPDAVKNSECHAKDPAHCPTHGTPITPATSETVKNFLADPPIRISPDMADALLSAGFDDKDGDGNTVKYGSLLKDHLDRESHSEKDRIARKQRLGEAVKVIRTSKPMPSGDPKKPNERVYSGLSNGKAYIGVADEHGELNAIVMVSYRRDGKHDE